MLRGLMLNHNAPVPRVARPALPSLAEEAVDAFGGRVRVAVLRALNEDGPSTKAELLRRLGGSDSNLGRHLSALEQLGVIVADPPRDDEMGPVTRRYDVDHDRVQELLAALASALTKGSRR
ncbi:helix-turn-helix transcriptional regulator [Nocardioides sp. BGMRC 2183]|nr:helix-turn-helix transcriptional regulator [Nocardioides sp. BGMRC 2183]